MKLFENGNPLNATPVLDVVSLPGLEPVPGERKVRRMFYLSDGNYAVITTDRVGAYDQPHVLPDGQPAFYAGKGIILNHFVLHGKKLANEYMPTDHIDREPYKKFIPPELWSRTSVVMPAKEMFRAEFVVRSTVEGSAEDKLIAGQPISGQYFSDQLRLGQMLPYPVFNPTTKAPKGQKDMEVNLYGFFGIIRDRDVANYLYGMSVILHLDNRKEAIKRGLDRPDQKLEFGVFEPGLPMHKNRRIQWEERYVIRLLADLCRHSNFPSSAWCNLPEFDFKRFLKFAADNAKTGIIRLCDEYFGTDDGRYRNLADTEMGLALYKSGNVELARVYMERYLCKECFRLESKLTGQGGYEKNAQQKVVMPYAVLRETGRRNLMACITMTKD